MGPWTWNPIVCFFLNAMGGLISDLELLSHQKTAIEEQGFIPRTRAISSTVTEGPPDDLRPLLKLKAESMDPLPRHLC